MTKKNGDSPEDSNEIEQNLRPNTSSKDANESKMSTRISVLASKSIPSPRSPRNKRMGLYSANRLGSSSSQTWDGQRGRSKSRARYNPLDKADIGQSRRSARTLESGDDKAPKRRGRSNCARNRASSVDIAKNRSQPGATDPVDRGAVRRRPTSTSRVKSRLESSGRRSPVRSARRCRSSSTVRTRRSGDPTLSGSSACLDVPSIAYEVSRKPSTRGSSRSSSMIRLRRSEDPGLNGSSGRLDAARQRSARGRSSSTSRLNSRNLDNTNESSASPSSLATNARRRRSRSRKTNRSTPSADSSGCSQDREAGKDELPHDDQDAKLQRRPRSSARGTVGRRPRSDSKSKGVTSEVSSEKRVGTRGYGHSQNRPKSTDRPNASNQSLSLESVVSKKRFDSGESFNPENDGGSARLDAARQRSARGRSSSTSRLNSRNLDNMNESSASPSSLATNARRRRSLSRKINRSTPSADSSGGSQDREAGKDGLSHDDQGVKLQRRSRSSSRGAVGRRPRSYSKSKGVTSEVSSEKKVGTHGNRNSQLRPKSTDRLNASNQSLSLESVFSKKSFDAGESFDHESLSDYIPENDGGSGRLDAARQRSARGRSSSTSRLNSRNLDNTNESSASPSSLATNARRRRSLSRKINRSPPSADSSGGSQDVEAKKDGLPHDDQDAKLQRRSHSSSRGSVGRRPRSDSKSKGVTSEVLSLKKVGTRGNGNSQFRPKSTDRLNASNQSLSLDASNHSLSLESVFSKKSFDAGESFDHESLSDYIPENDGEMSFQVIAGSLNQRLSLSTDHIGSDDGSGSLRKSFTAPYKSKSDLKRASDYEKERRRSSRGKLAGINAKRESRKSDIFASLDREEDEVNQQAGPLMRREPFRTQSAVGTGPLLVRAPPRRTSSDKSQFRGLAHTASKKKAGVSSSMVIRGVDLNDEDKSG
jgi:hypothetical protein